jgi:hypothetical protein
MKSIRVRYISMREKYPEPYSSYICFVRTIRGQKYSYEIISKWFGILVEKDDYAKSERNAIVKYLYKLSNTPEEKELQAKNRL